MWKNSILKLQNLDTKVTYKSICKCSVWSTKKWKEQKKIKTILNISPIKTQWQVVTVKQLHTCVSSTVLKIYILAEVAARKNK